MIGEDGNLKVDSDDNSGGDATGDNELGTNGEWEDAKRYEQGEEQEQSLEGEGDAMQVDDTAIDKEERKRRKKERRLAEKRAKSGGAEP